MSFHKKVLIAVVLLNLYLIGGIVFIGETKIDHATATDQDLVAEAMGRKLWPWACAMVSAIFVAFSYLTRAMVKLVRLGITRLNGR